jgi:hypothetical protein
MPKDGREAVDYKIDAAYRPPADHEHRYNDTNTAFPQFVVVRRTIDRAGGISAYFILNLYVLCYTTGHYLLQTLNVCPAAKFGSAVAAANALMQHDDGTNGRRRPINFSGGMYALQSEDEMYADPQPLLPLATAYSRDYVASIRRGNGSRELKLSELVLRIKGRYTIAAAREAVNEVHSSDMGPALQDKQVS